MTPEIPVRKGLAILLLAAVAAVPSAALAWGHEGHAVVALIAEHYMTRAALAQAASFSAAAPLMASHPGQTTTGANILRPARGTTSPSLLLTRRSTSRRSVQRTAASS